MLLSTPPAAGAALGEVVGATAGVGLVSLGLLAVAVAHRTRHTTVLTRAAQGAGRLVGRPGWAALPSLVTSVALLIALFGMLWDISLHIGNGRDPGPLANPAHYFILAGLYLVFASGVLAVILPLDEVPGPASVRLRGAWRAPVGGLLVAGSGFYALLGFPLDDVWHRLFGQDVTLFGPTHLMLITGAGLSLIGLLVLDREGAAAVTSGAAGNATAPSVRPLLARLRQTASLGGMLIGLSVFQGEFDFGVPQFRMVLHPMMIAAAAGLALVAARLLLGRGGALGCAAFFLLVRTTIAVLVGPVLGEPRPSFPLYLGEALVVELMALAPLVRRPLLYGAVGGLLIGTAGTATEAAWSRLAYQLPWTRDIAVEGVLLSALAGTAAGLCGALLALGVQGRLPRPRVARPVLGLSVLVLAALATDALVATVPAGASAQVSLTRAGTGDGPRVTAAVTLQPRSLGHDPSWLQITAWQGGGLVVDRLVRTGPGTYRSTRPVPVYGDWKTLLRLHDGRELSAVPLYLPADRAIGKGVAAVNAEPEFTRPFTAERAILQRERRTDVPGWLWAAASLVVLACSVALVASLALGVGRLNRSLQGEPAPREPARPARASARASVMRWPGARASRVS